MTECPGCADELCPICGTPTCDFIGNVCPGCGEDWTPMLRCPRCGEGTDGLFSVTHCDCCGWPDKEIDIRDIMGEASYGSD